MSTRCKPGDLAIIMYDVPQCAANIGRVVEISGPAEYDRHGRLTWLIQPVTSDPYLIHNSHDDSVGVATNPYCMKSLDSVCPHHHQRRPA